MNIETLKEIISSKVPEAIFDESGEFLNIIIEPKDLYVLAKYLRESDNTDLDYLFCLTCVDWLDFFYVVYHLTSKKYKHTLVLKAKISDRENPIIDSVADIWKTADFLEREVYDLFGIQFNDHPDLRRIFLDEDWNGYPLRKDYVDELIINN